MEVKLYDRNLTAPVLVEDLTYQHENLYFTTKLHGGFGECFFRLKRDWLDAYSFISDKFFYRLVISDAMKTLWEGFICDVGKDKGQITITSYGFLSACRDQPYKTAYNANANVVIKAILTAACPKINSDQTHIDATGGPTINSTAGADYLDITAQELIIKLAEFGDTLGNKWYFAIWENRIPYFFKRMVSTIDWKLNLSDLANFEIRHRTANLWNKVYAVYTSGGAVTRTADAQDTISQAKYGDGTNNLIRYYALPNLGAVSAAAAQAARDVWLNEHKDIWPSLENIILSDRVFDDNGVHYPSNWVRAGDVLRIRDLIPASADLDTVARNALSTFYIVETNYNAEQGTNQITVDVASEHLDALLADSLK